MPCKKRLMLVAGARPNFMKIAPVLREVEKRGECFEHVLVHTGQHYDEGMSEVFFRDLSIPKPKHHLNVGSGSHAQQTARIMTSFEPVLEEASPDCVLVFGDVNSTLACSIVAKKLGYKVAHVEAGLRSGDRAMPEEINRVVTDAISDYFFVTEASGVDHLRAEGHDEQRIFHVGHVMVDNLLFEIDRMDTLEGDLAGSSELKQGYDRFGVVTLHRPSNVDDEKTLRGILGALARVSADLPLVFPVHPRTRERIARFSIEVPSTIRLTEPLGYKEFLNLWRDATLLLTDSGGLQEETTALGVPCLTLRENTERPITITEGTNELVGVDPERIVAAAVRVLTRGADGRESKRPLLWDGHASERILDVLDKVLLPRE